MRILKPLPVIALITLLAFSALAQQKMGGKVIDVLDGKTLVIDMPNGKVTAVLHYIEIPESEQPLSQTVKDHLRNLVLGKTVMFEPKAILPTRTLGQIYLNGRDVGQQMVRDGAAWHTPAATTGQNREDSDSYETYQALARTEKRGIWSIIDLKPAWEYRAEKEKLARDEEQLQWQKASISRRNGASYGPSRNSPKSSKGINNVGALINNYDPQTKTGALKTPIFGVRDPDPTRITATSIGYFYGEDEKKGRAGYFAILMLSSADHARFVSNDLVLFIDGQKSVVGKAKRTQRTSGNLIEESLLYKINRSTVEKIANGSEVILKVGDYPIILLPGYQMIVFNLLDASK